MHVVGTSASFDVSLCHLGRSSATLPRETANRLRAAYHALALAAQGLVFAATIWLLLAAPGFLTTQESTPRMAATHQASR